MARIAYDEKGGVPRQEDLTDNTGRPGGTMGGTFIDTRTPSGGGSGNGTGANSVATSNAVATPSMSDYYSQIMATLQQQRAQQEALQRQQYEDALGRMQTAYDRSVADLNNQSDEALREAYINKMMGQRNLNQQLANMGINGGATESVLANLDNSYRNDRNSIQRALMNNLKALGADYDSNVANLSANYGNNYADLLNNYYNNLLNYQSDYAQQMANLASRSANATTSRSGATVTDEAPTPVTPTTDYTNYINTVRNLYKNTGSNTSVANYLKNSGLGEREITDVMYSAGYEPNDVLSLIYGNPAVPTTNNNVANNVVTPENVRSTNFNRAKALADSAKTSNADTKNAFAQDLADLYRSGQLSQAEYNDLYYYLYH